MARIRAVDPEAMQRQARDAIKVDPPKRRRAGWGAALIVALIAGAAIGAAISSGAFAGALEATQNALQSQ